MKVIYGAGVFVKPMRPNSLLAVDAGGTVVFHVPDKSPAAIRAQITRLKDELLAMPSPHQRDFEVTHTLIEGVYTRTLVIPKGSILVGKIHLKECVNIIAKGDISVLTETGAGRFTAGHVATSGAGIQKLGYAHEDTVFINVFRTDKTDISQIEAEIATDDCAALGFETKELLCL